MDIIMYLLFRLNENIGGNSAVGALGIRFMWRFKMWSFSKNYKLVSVNFLNLNRLYALQ